MDVLHAVKDDPPNLLETFVWTHDTDSVTLHEDVTLGKKFNSLSRPEFNEMHISI